MKIKHIIGFITIFLLFDIWLYSGYILFDLLKNNELPWPLRKLCFETIFVSPMCFGAIFLLPFLIVIIFPYIFCILRRYSFLPESKSYSEKHPCKRAK